MPSKPEARLYTLVLVLVAACGGGAAEQPAETTAVRQDDGRRDEPHDGLAITGLMGTISADAVQMAMDGKQRAFLDCFSRRVADVHMLSGDIHLEFRIDVEGHVLWVYPKTSTIGDRETEQCILDVAAHAHFRRPTGGEAEFGYPLGFDTAGDVRPAVAWTPDRVTAALAAHPGTASGCGIGGPAHVTAYVAPGGHVLAAGAAVDSHDALPQLDCVLEAVRGWTLPTPGSYPAKVSFDVD